MAAQLPPGGAHACFFTVPYTVRSITIKFEMVPAPPAAPPQPAPAAAPARFRVNLQDLANNPAADPGIEAENVQNPTFGGKQGEPRSKL
ncbi:hypothetical protein GOBAR_AA00855 [Gossypium barbadense]|uniref:Uncharacterized protein n=1 Tax=Gossypium barbadense TaxID=3634 RepID=A0A2P5YVU2_GOSBA|nr:hypothetical protein GOBAR_AA00855 [Gossypium barbadense]